MVLLSIDDLLLRRDERELLRIPSFDLREGWRVGLVGPNGSGKSSLLAVLAGRLAAAEGRVLRPPGVEVQLVEQATEAVAGATLWELARREPVALNALERELEQAQRSAARRGDTAAGLRYAELLSTFERRGGFGLATRLQSGLTRVGLPEASWTRLASDASGGERQRARLVGALAADADVLLLDEPSNHLDLPGRDWLVERVAAQRGAVLMASHDRSLLERVCTHVARIEAGQLRLRRGTFGQVAEAEASEARSGARREALRARRVAELERMAAELASFGHRGAQARRRRAERERERLQMTPAEASAGRPRASTAAPPSAPDDHRRRPQGLLLRARQLRVDGVLDETSLELVGGQRVALVGPSGSGKSTVLALIAGTQAADDARAQLAWLDGTSLLYCDQTGRGLDPEASPRTTLEAWVSATRASAALAAAGLPRAAWDRPSASLSGGERARAALALLSVREADVLVLDEPTNDLDLPGIEALEAFLCASPATIVLATHDETLVRALCAEVWSVEAGALVRYRGGLDGFRRGTRRLEPGLAAEPEPAATTSPQGGASHSDPAPAERPAAALQALEAERAAAEAALEDPTRWSERSRQRWRERRVAAEAALLSAWEATAAAPAPRFRTREAGVAVLADRDGEGLEVRLEAGPGLRVRRIGQVAHLVPHDDPTRSTVPWAWRALCHGAARLALYLLPVEAVQVATHEPLDDGPFEPLGLGWWVARRVTLERREGWLRRPPARPRRRSRRCRYACRRGHG